MGHSRMTNIIIVEHRAKELANYLWNDLSVTAFGMETGARVINTTRLEHIRFWRYLHMLYSRLVDVATRKTCGIWTTGTPKFLPPTVPPPKKFEACDTLYFFGWLFRNPVGLKKYRDALIKAFAPDTRIQNNIQNILATLPSERTLIGVHIRQRPFKGFENGEFLVPPARMRAILEEYLREKKLRAEDVALVVVSDRPVLSDAFDDFTTAVSIEDEKTNLFLLSKCSAIIGDNSTFSNLAAWFGNVPHIVATEEPVDWPYYEDKKQYFENKYATFTHGSLVYP
ncbi:MAG: hypothetical protein Q8P23_02940 [bacterium]|nr:hypothetical protein [bacterium]